CTLAIVPRWERGLRLTVLRQAAHADHPSQHLPSRLLPGAPADQQFGPDRDERADRLRARGQQGVREHGGDDLRAGLCGRHHAGGFVRPELSRLARDWFPTPFLGSFLMLSVVAAGALFVQARVELPPPKLVDHAGGGRPLSEIMRQPVFIVAALSAALGYGLMN